MKLIEHSKEERKLKKKTKLKIIKMNGCIVFNMKKIK